MSRNGQLLRAGTAHGLGRREWLISGPLSVADAQKSQRSSLVCMAFVSEVATLHTLAVITLHIPHYIGVGSGVPC